MYFSSQYFVLLVCIFAFALNILATDKGITFDGIRNFVSYTSLTTYDEDPQFTDAKLTYLVGEAFARCSRYTTQTRPYLAKGRGMKWRQK